MLKKRLDFVLNFSYHSNMNKANRREYQKLYYREHLTTQRLRQRWRNMRLRCHDPKVPGYKYYGGRGIKVCKEWRNDYNCFERWAFQNGFRPSLQIDRIDNDGDYTPQNCHFVTPKEQAKNRRNGRNLTFQGKTQCVAAWAEELGISRQTLHHRLKCSEWTVEKALTAPLGTGAGRPRGSYGKKRKLSLDMN